MFFQRPYLYLSQDAFLILDAISQEKILADHFCKNAAHEPIFLDFGGARSAQLNCPFESAESKELFATQSPLLRVKIRSDQPSLRRLISIP